MYMRSRVIFQESGPNITAKREGLDLLFSFTISISVESMQQNFMVLDGTQVTFTASLKLSGQEEGGMAEKGWGGGMAISLNAISKLL